MIRNETEVNFQQSIVRRTKDVCIIKKSRNTSKHGDVINTNTYMFVKIIEHVLDLDISILVD